MESRKNLLWGIVLLVLVPSKLVQAVVSLSQYDLFLIRNENASTQSLVLYSPPQDGSVLGSSESITIRRPAGIKFFCGAANANNSEIYLGGDSGVILRINTVTGTQDKLRREDSTRITAMHYVSNKLCWIADHRILSCMNAGDPDNIQVIKTDPMFLTSLTGIKSDLYFTHWNFSSYSIFKLDVNSISPHGENNVPMKVEKNTTFYQPHALVNSGSKLYYVNHPPGIYVQIKRFDTTNPNTTHETVYRKPYKRIKSLAMACGTKELYWSDGGNKNALWKVVANEMDDKEVEIIQGKVVYVFGKDECGE